MWKCCFAIMIVAIIITYSQFVHPMLRQQISTFDVISMVWGAVCQQGTHLNIPTTSGRFIVLTTFLATLAIFTSYSASIVALLQSPSHLIKNIDDLLNSPLKMALQEAGYNRYNFLQENISILQKVWKKKLAPMGDDAWVITLHYSLHSTIISCNYVCQRFTIRLLVLRKFAPSCLHFKWKLHPFIRWSLKRSPKVKNAA